MQGSKEFLVEVLMLSLLKHKNLLDQRLLVYNYMPLCSLDTHLFGIYVHICMNIFYIYSFFYIYSYLCIYSYAHIYSFSLKQVCLAEKASDAYYKLLRVQPLLDSSIQYHIHSSLSQSAACSYKISPPRATNDEAMHSFHSLPLSMLERAQDSSSVSLAEHLATDKSFDHVRETPNRLSEEMVECITEIYCQLAEPPLLSHGLPTSSISFSSSMNDSPPQLQYYDRGSPQHRENSSFSKWVIKPFHVEDSNELSGTYSTVIEIQGICRDAWRLRGVEHMLQHFRSSSLLAPFHKNELFH